MFEDCHTFVKGGMSDLTFYKNPDFVRKFQFKMTISSPLIDPLSAISRGESKPLECTAFRMNVCPLLGALASKLTPSRHLMAGALTGGVHQLNHLQINCRSYMGI